MDFWNFLGLMSISDSIDRNTAAKNAGVEAASTDKFLNENSWCYIQSKEARPTRHKRYLLDFSKEYWLTCIGLDTGETKEILVGEELFKSAITEARFIQFAKHKATDLVLFKQRNKKSGATILKKYSEANHIYLVRLYGNDSDSICVVTVDKDFFDSCTEGDTLFKEQTTDTTSLNADEQPDYSKIVKDRADSTGEATWYTVGLISTYEIEEIIANSTSEYLYAYFEDSNDINSFTITDIEPAGKMFIDKWNIASTIVKKFMDTPFGDASISDDELEKWMDSVPETEIPKYKKICADYTELMSNGCARCKIAALRQYPTETRDNFCLCINSIWDLGFWYKPGKLKEALTEATTKPDIIKKLQQNNRLINRAINLLDNSMIAESWWVNLY